MKFEVSIRAEEESWSYIDRAWTGITNAVGRWEEVFGSEFIGRRVF